MGFFSPPTIRPQTAPQVPTREDPRVEEARARELEQARKLRGRAATFRTGGQDLGPAPIARKQLLGE